MPKLKKIRDKTTEANHNKSVFLMVLTVVAMVGLLVGIVYYSKFLKISIKNTILRIGLVLSQKCYFILQLSKIQVWQRNLQIFLGKGRNECRHWKAHAFSNDEKHKYERWVHHSCLQKQSQRAECPRICPK